MIPDDLRAKLVEFIRNREDFYNNHSGEWWVNRHSRLLRSEQELVDLAVMYLGPFGDKAPEAQYGAEVRRVS